MSNDETSIHSLHLKMREELQSVVYTTTSLGGILGFLVSTAIADITDVRRFVLIVCGCLAGLYLGRLRKKDINEKRLIVSSQLDLLDLLQKQNQQKQMNKLFLLHLNLLLLLLALKLQNKKQKNQKRLL